MANFQTTRWSIIVGARERSPLARAALEALCRAYRPPVLAFIRHSGHSPSEAEDLAQAFFLRFLEARGHEQADPALGRFRNFLLTAVRNFLADQVDLRRALKRGGHCVHESLELHHSERIAGDPAQSPEHAFDRSWALTVVERALQRLRDDAERAGKQALFDRLREFLLESPDPSAYALVAAELGMRGNTLAVTVHRLRERLREKMREELADTVDSSAAVDDELQALRAVLAS